MQSHGTGRHPLPDRAGRRLRWKRWGFLVLAIIEPVTLTQYLTGTHPSAWKVTVMGFGGVYFIFMFLRTQQEVSRNKRATQSR